jgi:glycine oxidase
MASRPTVGIVGSGIIGCAIAFELADRGADVTVFDARTLAGGATQASAGILAPYIEAHEGGPLHDLTVRGLAEYDRFVDRVRGATDVAFEYRRCGTLEIADTDERARELQSRISSTSVAAARLRWLDGEALRDAVPILTDGARGGILCEAHGYVSVPSFVDALADGASRLGVSFQLSAAVERIELRTRDVVVHTVLASHGFDRVVLCAGAWTPSIDADGLSRRDIRPVRGQLVRLRAESLAIPHVLWGSNCYIVPWQDGTVLVGATSEDVGFDERATVEGVGGLLDAATALVPALASATFVDVRVGLRPATSDGLPILGPAEDPRVLYAAGHFRNGVLLAPLTARLIADYISGRSAGRSGR